MTTTKTTSMFLILFVAIFACIDLGAGLHCYTCIASTNSNCYDGVVPSYIHQECVQQAYQNFSLLPSLPQLSNIPLSKHSQEPIKTVCVRLEYSVLSDIFLRGCGFIYESMDICEYLAEYVDYEECSSCDTDYCNGRPAFT